MNAQSKRVICVWLCGALFGSTTGLVMQPAIGVWGLVLGDLLLTVNAVGRSLGTGAVRWMLCTAQHSTRHVLGGCSHACY
jgi:hypothetical protein